MSFESSIQKTFSHRNWKKAIQALKNYLDSIEYHYIYKYLAMILNYHANSSVFSTLNRKTFHLIDAAMEGCDWGLAKTLTTHCPCPFSDLSKTDMDAAYLLCEAGMLSEDSGNLTPGDFQLLSVGGKYLIIDAAIHFTKGRIHEIYIGKDTMMMLYYMGLTPRESKALDICSGTGILGLSMTDFADVTVTDISPAALSLISVNAVLNGAEDKISILDEDMRTTLDEEKTFDVITCNPPFVAFPPDLRGPLYAEGTGKDGLDYLRLLLGKTPGKLNEGGTGFFVADLPGDDFSPHFLSELEEYAGRAAIDVYIDDSSPVSSHVGSLSPFIARMYPDRDKDSILGELSRFVRDVLNARRYYLTTIRMKKNGGTGIRIFNRLGGRPGKTEKGKNERRITRYDQLFREGHEK
jgi:hypothetical protein